MYDIYCITEGEAGKSIGRRKERAHAGSTHQSRTRLGLSQTDLAERVGATRQTIGLIGAGRYNPSLKLCTAICRTLGKTLDDLFWEAGE